MYVAQKGVTLTDSLSYLSYPTGVQMSWLEDQNHFDETGEQPDWKSRNRHVPKSYRLDLEFNCFTNAENLSELSSRLRYVEGEARLKGDRSKDAWGDHAWCVVEVTGEAVDPYFEWKFPGKVIEYREVSGD
jgi:hypothetical protein